MLLTLWKGNGEYEKHNRESICDVSFHLAKNILCVWSFDCLVLIFQLPLVIISHSMTKVFDFMDLNSPSEPGANNPNR